jgi:hypothetical protein
MGTNIVIEDFYPGSYQPRRRWGGEKPVHPEIEALIASGLARYESLLEGFTRFTPDFLAIGREPDPDDPHAPAWENGFFPAFDAVALYGLVATRQPRTYCEIGSGSSTRFAVAAKRAHSPDTRVVSIDPAPRGEIDQICDVVIRSPLQDCELDVFADLRPADLLFLDGSHRALQNSDVSVFFLEVLPILRPGVLVHVHDVFWPIDYPSEWANRMYSEQYLLGTILLFAPEKFEIVLPNTYISYMTGLASIFTEVWSAPHLWGIDPHGGSFWFTKK